MKLAPANQTFIPASHPGSQRFGVSSKDAANAQLGQALRTAVQGATLKSVTIVAARADDNVVLVQAQYATDLDAVEPAASVALKLIARQPTLNRASGYLSPIERYTQTQSGATKSAPLLDVRA